MRSITSPPQCPEPRIIPARTNHLRLPWIAANIRKFFLQIRLRADQAVEGFFVPNRTFDGPEFVDPVGRDRFDALQNLGQEKKGGIAGGIRFFHLRFKQQVDVIGHHAGHIEKILAVLLWEFEAIEDDVPLGIGQRPSLIGGKGDGVFGPWTFEVREAAFGIECAFGGQ